MAKKYKNFDKFFEETAKDNEITIKLFGEKHKISGSIPASVVLLQYRAYMENREELTPEEQMRVAIELIGEETIAEWSAKGLTAKQLTEILTYILEELEAPEGPEEDKQGAVKK